MAALLPFFRLVGTLHRLLRRIEPAVVCHNRGLRLGRAIQSLRPAHVLRHDLQPGGYRHGHGDPSLEEERDVRLRYSLRCCCCCCCICFVLTNAALRRARRRNKSTTLELCLLRNLLRNDSNLKSRIPVDKNASQNSNRNIRLITQVHSLCKDFQAAMRTKCR